jgi:3-methyladenine DNA glycosylase AlkD
LTKDNVFQFFESHQNASLIVSQSKRIRGLTTYGLTMKELRDLAKSIGTDHDLAIELFTTNIYDAMMLATLIASPPLCSPTLLHSWALYASSTMVVDQGLSALILNSIHRHEIVSTWTLHPHEDIRYAGYSFLSSYFRMEKLELLDISLGSALLSKIEQTILQEPSTIQNAMNNAVVMAGLHVPALFEQAKHTAEVIGYIMPLIAKNSCNIQSALDYIVRYIDQPQYSRNAKLRKESS